MSKNKYILNTLLKEKSIQFKNGLYSFTQCFFAYNSNKIEGNILTEEQTRQIYETKFLSFSKDTNKIKIDDALETINHFRMFNFILETVNDDISKEYILKLHKILKRGTSDEDDIENYNVGGFKTRPNIIGVVNVIQTSKPEEVENDLDNLLSKYHAIDKVQFEDIIDFHKNFETIHPLSDGNGRVGRMIMFKECLKNDILPFVVRDENKEFYLRGLREFKYNKQWLIDTCLHEQDTYDNICEQLNVYQK